MINLSAFKPPQEEKIILQPNQKNLDEYNKLSDDMKVWADELCLYKYKEYAQAKIQKYLKSNSNSSINSYKSILEVVTGNDKSLTERNILCLQTVCLAIWKERTST